MKYQPKRIVTDEDYISIFTDKLIEMMEVIEKFLMLPE